MRGVDGEARNAISAYQSELNRRHKEHKEREKIILKRRAEVQKEKEAEAQAARDLADYEEDHKLSKFMDLFETAHGYVGVSSEVKQRKEIHYDAPMEFTEAMSFSAGVIFTDHVIFRGPAQFSASVVFCNTVAF